MSIRLTLFLISILFFFSSCVLSSQENQVSDNSFSEPPSFKQIVSDAEKNAEEGDSSALLRAYGHQWFYGRGVGRTIANVGTVVLFPPYALYLLGNAGLALAGYEPLYVTSALPEGARQYTLAVYDGITSVPGRVTAGLAGEEFQGGRTLTAPVSEETPDTRYTR